jgi:hypothetical protein
MGNVFLLQSSGIAVLFKPGSVGDQPSGREHRSQFNFS